MLKSVVHCRMHTSRTTSAYYRVIAENICSVSCDIIASAPISWVNCIIPGSQSDVEPYRHL